MKEIDSYFEFQEKYFDFLHDKLGALFKGEARKANGMIKIGEYHAEWDYLSSIERRCKFKSIALRCMKGEDVLLKIRNGSSYMEAETNISIFPKMKPTKYLNTNTYGRQSIGYPIYLWRVNEVCELID